SPVYDLEKFRNISEAYEKNELAYLEQYYSKYYVVDLRLAPTHPLLQRSEAQSSSDHYPSNIQTIEYDVKVKSSINKKRQDPLSINTEICAITTEEGKRYSIKAGVAGWIIDINMRLEHEKELLQNKPFKEGYIAIIKPRQENSDKSLSHCFSEERYKLFRNLLYSATPVNRLASVSHDTGPVTKPSDADISIYADGHVRNDWTQNEIKSIYDSPIMSLLYYGAKVHRKYHNPLAVQQCTLLSIKTGGCSEDCAYCPQSSKYKTAVKATKLLDTDDVITAAKNAKKAGSTRCVLIYFKDTSTLLLQLIIVSGIIRFCMGAAWRDLNVCCTLGMLNETQAKALKEAGLTAYNHNLDTSREYYPKIITTRSYDERLETISNVQNAGISVCSGGIIGLGETPEDRVNMLHTLATFSMHPESVPVNALVQVEGTPLDKQEPVSIWEMIRMIATARIIMPKSMVRLSAGRIRFSQPEQALCFLAGANSIFTGDKLLTTDNNDFDADQEMFKILGLTPKAANFNQGSSPMINEPPSLNDYDNKQRQNEF
ncbi:4315_t:CDS:10, partial [Racocetra persica]